MDLRETMQMKISTCALGLVTLVCISLPVTSSLQVQSPLVQQRTQAGAAKSGMGRRVCQDAMRRPVWRKKLLKWHADGPRQLPKMRHLRGGASPKDVQAWSVAVKTALLLLSLAPGAGVQAAASEALVNCVGQATLFFINMRVPAALVAGAALGNIWATIGDKDDPSNHKYQALYTLLVCLCVVLEFSTVFIATASDVKLMSGKFSSPMASSTVAFLTREMEFSFLAVRLQFALGILSFLGAMAVRALVTFPGNIGNASGLVFLGTGCSLLCMINISLWEFVMMHFKYVELFVKQFAAFSSPLGFAAVLFGLGGSYFLVLELLETLPARQRAKPAVKGPNKS